MIGGAKQDAASRQCFSDNALALAGLAGRNLGWRPDDFWQATPVELLAMLGLTPKKPDSNIAADTINSLLKEFPDG